MKNTSALILAALCLLISLCFAGQKEDKTHQHDILYAGHAQNHKVFSIDLGGGNATYVNHTFASHAPNAYTRGLFFKGDDFTVAFERSDVPFESFGAILQFDKTGLYKRTLVAPSDPEAPFRPRGIIWIPGNLLVVADNGYIATEDISFLHQGYIRIYDYTTGQFLRKFTAPVDQISTFQPRAVVYVKGKLYVTSYKGAFERESQLLGYLSRFDPLTGFETVVANHSTAPHLHRPDGLAFGPDGNLWVTSFRNFTDPADVDKILVMNLQGETLMTIPLWTPFGFRRFAQGLVFGPDDVLYIGMTSRGEIWQYNLELHELTFVFSVNDGGQTFTDAVYFLSFAKTNPSSLEYISN